MLGFYLGFAGIIYAIILICGFAGRGDPDSEGKVKLFAIGFTILWAILGLLLLVGGVF